MGLGPFRSRSGRLALAGDVLPAEGSRLPRCSADPLQAWRCLWAGQMLTCQVGPVLGPPLCRHGLWGALARGSPCVRGPCPQQQRGLHVRCACGSRSGALPVGHRAGPGLMA